MDCDTGRCFDRGHLVPSEVAGEHYGRSGQTFSMCNIGGQTAVLNECKWEWLEKVIACTGQYRRMLVLSGAVGPFSPSERMASVSRPAAFFKVVFVPSSAEGARAASRGTAFVWLLQNDLEPTYAAADYRGRAGLDQIEASLGFRFPDVVRKAHFPEDCSWFTELLSHSGRMDACGIGPTGISFKSGPYYLLQTCAGKAGHAPTCGMP